LLGAAKAKAKELQQDAADKIDKIDKGIKGDGATLERDETSDDAGPPSGTDKGDEGRPPSSHGDERAAS
jgi:hypothetical protein